MTVFVLQKDPTKDFSAAQEYGAIQYLWGTNRNVFPDNADRRTDDMAVIARRDLASFNPDEDFLLLNGDPIGIGIATAVLSERFQMIPVLKWDNQFKQYYEVMINLKDRSD